MIIKPSNSLAWDYPFPLLIDGFRVYANGEMVWEIQDRNILSASVADLNLNNGVEYEVAVTAYLGDQESNMSAPVNFTYLETVHAPTNLRIE